MEGTLEEKRLRFRLHFGTLIRVTGTLTWLIHLSVVLILTAQPSLEIQRMQLNDAEMEHHLLLFEFRSKRVYFAAAEHVVILWNLIYTIVIPGHQNRIWCYVWLHYNMSATPVLVLSIYVIMFASQDMSYYIVMDNCWAEEAMFALGYFLMGFNTYLLAYNQLRFLQNQVTRPFKPGVMKPSVSRSTAVSGFPGVSTIKASRSRGGSSPTGIIRQVAVMPEELQPIRGSGGFERRNCTP